VVKIKIARLTKLNARSRLSCSERQEHTFLSIRAHLPDFLRAFRAFRVSGVRFALSDFGDDDSAITAILCIFHFLKDLKLVSIKMQLRDPTFVKSYCEDSYAKSFFTRAQ
jgi:EAL domain-containing protein (putative c-di-GMP-specific phosphodiesterase class I)